MNKELKDKELEQVTGGGPAQGDQPKCPVYQYKKEFKSCPIPDMGVYKQCPGCDLNVE